MSDPLSAENSSARVSSRVWAGVAFAAGCVLLAGLFFLAVRPHVYTIDANGNSFQLSVAHHATLLPVGCVPVSWTGEGIARVILNGAPAEAEMCLKSGQPLVWRVDTEEVALFTYRFYISALLFRLDVYLVLYAVIVCWAVAARAFLTPLSAAATRFLRFQQAFARRLFTPGQRLKIWFTLIFALINLAFCLSFAEIALARATNIEQVVAGLFAGAALVVAVAPGWRPIQRLLWRVLPNVLFPFGLVMALALFTGLQDALAAGQTSPLLTEIAIWQATLYLLLFFAWLFACGTALYCRGFRVKVRTDVPPEVARLARWRWIGLLMLCAVLIAVWGYINLLNPVPLYADAEAAFFIDAVSFNKMHTFYFTFHPGTSAEHLSAGLLALSYPFTKIFSSDFIGLYLSSPMTFVLLARVLFLLLNLACVLALSYMVVPRVTHWTDVPVAWLVPLAYFALHPQAFYTLGLWSHHPLGFVLGVLLLLGLLALVRAESVPRLRQFGVLALGAGLLTALQYYLTPMIVTVIVTGVLYYWLQRRAGWRWLLVVLLMLVVMSITGFLSGTAIIADRYATLFSYILLLASHIGIYGTGEVGFSVAQLSTNFGDLAANFGVSIGVIVLLVVLAVGLLLWRKTAGAGWTAMLVAVLLHLGVVVFLVVRHYNIFYAVNITAVTVILLVLVLLITRHVQFRLYRWLGIVLLPVFIVSTLLNMGGTLQRHQLDADHARTSVTELETVLREYALAAGKLRGDLIVVRSLGTYSDCQFLWFGNAWTALHLTGEIQSICPNQPGHTTTPLEDMTWDLLVVPQDMDLLFKYSQQWAILATADKLLVLTHE